jgi:hypothetical protein
MSDGISKLVRLPEATPTIGLLPPELIFAAVDRPVTW